MKVLLLVLTIMILGACGSDGDNSSRPGPSSGSDKESPVAVPTEPVKEAVWGDLECQKTSRCENPVLNLPKAAILDFFSLDFASEVAMEDPAFSFACGYELSERWALAFPEHSDLAWEDWKQISDFSVSMIDVETCAAFADGELRMDEYFQIEKGKLK